MHKKSHFSKVASCKKSLTAITVCLILAFAFACMSWGHSSVKGSGLYMPAYQVNKIKALSKCSNQEITESSGLVRSQLLKKIFWTHNDSGNSPKLYPFLMDGKDAFKGIKIKGAYNYDWEDIAIDRQNARLIIGDIGDNRQERNHSNNGRKALCFYIVYENDLIQPQKALTFLNESGKSAQKINFYYPENKSYNAEAIFYFNQAIYLLTKSSEKTLLFKIACNPGSAPVEAKKIGELNFSPAISEIGRLVTSADISPDGKKLAILTYLGAFLFTTENPNDEDWLEGKVYGIRLFTSFLDINWNSQYEGICFIDDQNLLVSSENVLSQISPNLLKLSVSDFELIKER